MSADLKLLGVVWMTGVALGLFGLGSADGQGVSGEWTALSVKDPQGWSFLGGAWLESEEGIIAPPAERADDHLAFNVSRAYSDLEAELEFRWDINHCGAGFVVRAQDPSHYYLVYFPCCGQHYRAKHFWAAIAKADGSGWLKMLRMEMVQGVPSELQVWHKARVVVEGNEIRLWVDGRPFPAVQDDEYASGYVGLESWTFATPGSSFRNVRIRGQQVQAQPWDETKQPPQNWFRPYPNVEGQQSTTSITRAPNGDLLMAVSPGGLLRSTDNGRTWAPAGPQEFPGGYVHTTRDGRLIAVGLRDAQITLSTSDDNGTTWSEPQDCGEITMPPGVAKLSPSINPLLELQDGTLLLFLLGGHDSTSGGGVLEWGSVHCVAYSMRSTDGGQTWTGPTTLDGPPAVGVNLDLTEPYAAQTDDGRVLCLIRPIYSPWMWETWSDNGGESWGPTVRGPFPGYACAMLPHPTASGALVIGGRMPGLGLHVSRDNGITWEHYQAGTDVWAMGSMYEVEPDVILWVYMDSYSGPLRAQFVRITPDGAEPAREMLPGG
jgi:photosystem II stability/assembly factor-like uncharacterized protein